MTQPGATGPHRALDLSDPAMIATVLGQLERDVASSRVLVDELRALVGQAPNMATGEPGTGLCRVVAELAEQRPNARRHILRGGIYGGVAVALLEMSLRLLDVFGG